ncbi:MAG: hypothetical protein K0S27_1302 [Gammaproteobacteria bacterium]|jgi:hypothetical protein|nr:hypothetical protein [Gammaproteobacteria bacterium]
MPTRLNYIIDIFTAALSFASALNACLFRSEQIDHLLNPGGSQEQKLANSLLSLVNVLAVTSEVIYNVKRNAHLKEPWREIVGREEETRGKEKGGGEREENLSETDQKDLISVDRSRQQWVTSGLSTHTEDEDNIGLQRNPVEGIEEAEEKNSLMGLPLLVAVMSVPVAIGHFAIFYDANAKMFKEKYEIKISNTHNYGVTPKVLSGGLSATGAIQEGLHGGLALAMGAASVKPLWLFFNSKEEDVYKNIAADCVVNLLLFFSVMAEFAIFITEFNEQAIKTDLLGLDKHFLKLICVSLSLLSAAMYLGHEGHMLLKINKLFKGPSSHEKYKICFVPSKHKYSHIAHGKNTIILYQEKGVVMRRWHKGNEVSHKPLRYLGAEEERRIMDYLAEEKKELTSDEDEALVYHIAIVSGYSQPIERNQFFYQKFYFLGCFLNAIVHGVSRYPMLEGIYQDFMPLTIARVSAAGCASVSFFSRLATLAIEEESEEKDLSHKDKSLKYDARQRSQDIIYEVCFILLIGLMAIIEKKNDEYKSYSHAVIIFACNALAATITEVILYALHKKYKEMQYEFAHGNRFFIDVMAAPGLGLVAGAFLKQGLFFLKESKDVDYNSSIILNFGNSSFIEGDNSQLDYTSWISQSSLSVISTLILRHLLKKACLPPPKAASQEEPTLSCCERISHGWCNFFRRRSQPVGAAPRGQQLQVQLGERQPLL